MVLQVRKGLPRSWLPTSAYSFQMGLEPEKSCSGFLGFTHPKHQPIEPKLWPISKGIWLVFQPLFLHVRFPGSDSENLLMTWKRWNSSVESAWTSWPCSKKSPKKSPSIPEFFFKRKNEKKNESGEKRTCPTRWAPTIYKSTYNPCKWPYKWVTGVITLLVGVITTVVTGRGPTGFLLGQVGPLSSRGRTELFVFFFGGGGVGRGGKSSINQHLPAPSKGCQWNPKGWWIDTLYEQFGTLWKVQV